MSRRIVLSVPSELRSQVVEDLQAAPGVASVSLQVGSSVSPPGDVISIDATNEATLAVMKLLEENGVLDRGAVTLSEPTAIISAPNLTKLDHQGNEGAWEEVGEQLRRDTNVTFNFLLLMAASGAIASFGLVSDTLHIVIGAMLIAPGFEPLLRIVFGIMGRRYGPGAGLRSTLAGYLALAIGAAAAAPVALLLQNRTGAELPDLQWAGYWSSVQVSGIAVSLIAGAAGATIVSARLTVFATGVMVALALVPAMALVGLGGATGNLGLAFSGILRWGVEVFCVLVAGGAVLAIKRRVLHDRRVFD
ncbi:DUF389 domain-containing protein [Microvirga lenta]|uniref:DUF389 domain-containing protein n=1 Tax=Microvirga lenta TaxID=2881337 RepID=UPI001CFF9EE6|nr:DUF389 domain-containing protein [Microvirga lenta]MCB5177525.1 DUF389 domain-containing protein [Microvirga lenta]